MLPKPIGPDWVSDLLNNLPNFCSWSLSLMGTPTYVDPLGTNRAPLNIESFGFFNGNWACVGLHYCKTLWGSWQQLHRLRPHQQVINGITEWVYLHGFIPQKNTKYIFVIGRGVLWQNRSIKNRRQTWNGTLSYPVPFLQNFASRSCWTRPPFLQKTAGNGKDKPW